MAHPPRAYHQIVSAVLRDDPGAFASSTDRVAADREACLAKDPDRRFPTMADVRQALQHLTGGRADATASIGRLPFANLSADPEQEYFSDGLADESSALAKICLGFELA